jgi:hypothetical protein
VARSETIHRQREFTDIKAVIGTIAFTKGNKFVWVSFTGPTACHDSLDFALKSMVKPAGNLLFAYCAFTAPI